MQRPSRENRGPFLAADAIIELPDRRIVLIERGHAPPGWAIPGGFVEYGESLEAAAAAVREAREETGLEIELLDLLYVYSDPARDPRHHTVTAVFTARAEGIPTGGDDAASAIVVAENELPSPLAFDHTRVLADYFEYRRSGKHPKPRL